MMINMTINRLWIRLTIAFIIVTQLSIVVVAALANSSISGEFRRYIIRKDVVASGAESGSVLLYSQVGTVTGVKPLLPTEISGEAKYTKALPPLVADARGNIIFDPDQKRVGTTLSTDELSVAVPFGSIDTGGEPAGYLFPSNPSVDILFQKPEQDFLNRLRNTLTVAALVVGGIGILIGLVISRTMVAPLGNLARAARAFAAHDWSQRVQAQGADEIAEVAHAFNEMADEIQRAETLRRNMMADIAHELRTPLTVMQGNLRALLDGIYSLSKHEIAILYENTCTLSRLVDDLRELARADAGQLVMNIQRIDLAATLQAVVANFAAAAESQNVQLRLDCDEALPEVSADPARLAQVLGNLLTNALRHTSEGSITLSAAPQRFEHGERVCISVVDSGEGIAPDDLPHIFERLYRADKSRSRSSGNSGLGLAIAKAWVEAMRGQIGVESTLGQGSRFWFSLPAGGQGNRLLA
jgi:signal transduction histidine kinase